jgi:hypothetical protein
MRGEGVTGKGGGFVARPMPYVNNAGALIIIIYIYIYVYTVYNV